MRALILTSALLFSFDVSATRYACTIESVANVNTMTTKGISKIAKRRKGSKIEIDSATCEFNSGKFDEPSGVKKAGSFCYIYIDEITFALSRTSLQEGKLGMLGEKATFYYGSCETI